jgi:molybdopterin-guanine dinucleotide biosynthesis protein A
VDPELAALRNVNTPGEYDSAVAVGPPRVTIELVGGNAGDARLEVHASRLEQAYAAAGLALDAHVVAAVNGEQIAADPWYPLATGDLISLQPRSGMGGGRERHRSAE